MDLILDPKIIKQFRSKVHEHNDFIRLYFVDYKVNNDVGGKDIWSKICSCMDWLTVTVDGIEKPEINSNMNVTSLNFTHFLVTIDMVIEAVNHLWLSIGQVNDVKQPYLEDRSIFKGEEFDKIYTDEKYFKLIRSWFGIHSVNGNVVNLKGFSKGIRFFSSWSSNLLNENEFSIQLYSNNRKAEKRYGGRKSVDIDKLVLFLTLRYNSLNQLMKEIDHLYFKKKKRLQNTPVQFNRDETVFNQLKMLYEESKERVLTAEYYEYYIQDYLSFLSCNLDEFEELEKSLVTIYLIDLEPIILIYHKAIQNVEYYESDVFELLSLRSQTYMDNNYDFSKVLEYANGGGSYPTASISLDILIEKGLLPTYCVDLSKLNLYLLIHAIDHNFAKNNSSELKYK